MTKAADLQQKRTAFLMKVGTSRPDHEWEDSLSGCARCPNQSPFRWEPGAHRFVIEEAL